MFLKRNDLILAFFTKADELLKRLDLSCGRRGKGLVGLRRDIVLKSTLKHVVLGYRCVLFEDNL